MSRVAAGAPLIEVCVEGIDDALAAEQGGADRVELCASLLEGGITPSDGTIRETRARLRIPVHVIVRPRGGDFLYSEAEFATMLADIGRLRETGAAGAVIGCLNPDGTVDEKRTAALAAAAGPLSVTFHRAFDVTADPGEALEALIRCGIGRVLTSGQQPDAVAGIELLARLHRQAAGRITVMGCGNLREATIGRVWRETGLTELHFAAQAERPSMMTYRNEAIAMGQAGTAREYRQPRTDAALVARIIAAI
jgi:copper homeostasis protein